MTSSQKDLYQWADQIPVDLWNNLQNGSSQQAAEMVGAVWDGNTFKMPLLGIQHVVDPANRRIKNTCHDDRPVSYQAGVVLLTTLSISKGVPASGRMTVPQELPGGQMFFTGAHAIANVPLARYIEKNPEQLVDRVLEIGGAIIEGADIALQIPGLPYVPLYILFWQGDQEIPARAVVGIDDRAPFHLDLGGVFALTNLLVFEFCKVITNSG